MVIAEFSITPLDEEEMRPFVDAAIDEVKKSGLKYEVEAMGTSIEGELDQILDVVKKAHYAAKQKGAKRIITEIRFDDRSEVVSMEEELEGYRVSV